ncbi:acyl carrier protein [Francisella halioticida]|uniref:Acyl carrier protein n=1 Tax=Francisella halioticida TaxID=549298 RepID=A0ABM6M1X4_9GAMM|nr:acyl carrier protein [Francisella halioticida]ASG68887.1 acyl carrier protein [Francisella halioticida]BCD91876.1 acyl carrier protein [Francisella halioticida]
MSFSKEEIFIKLQDMLQELFEIDKGDISLESSLYEDLELDSIDAVDLIVQLQSITKRKFSPEEFKSVRTIKDVVDIISKVMESE